MKNKYKVSNGVATVELTQGQVMLVSEIVLPLLSPHRWVAHRRRNTFYVTTNIRLPDGCWKTLDVHRLLMGLDFGDPRQVDHINGDGLNNLFSNLRTTDHARNAHNQHGKQPHKHGETPTSRFPGVCWDKKRKKWHTQIMLSGRIIHLGRYDIEEDAAETYIRAKAVRGADGTREEIKASVSKELNNFKEV